MNNTDPIREVPADGHSGDSTASTSPEIQGTPGSSGPQQGPLNQLPAGQTDAVHQNGQPSANDATGNHQQLPPGGSVQSDSQDISAQGWAQQPHPYAPDPALPGSEGLQPASGYQSANGQPFVQGPNPPDPFPAQLPPGAAQSGYQAQQQGWSPNYQQTDYQQGPAAAQSGYQAQQQGWSPNYQQTDYQQGPAAGYQQGPTSGYQQGPTSGYQQSGGPSGTAMKSPKLMIAIVVGALLVVGGTLAYFLLSDNSSTPSAPVTTASPSSRSASPSPSASPTARSTSPSPSASPTTSPAPSQSGGGLLTTRTLKEIVYPQKIGNFTIDTPSDDKLATYVFRDNGRSRVTMIQKRASTTLSQDAALLTQAETFPGGVCGIHPAAGQVCSLGTKDGVLAINGATESAAELKAFTLDVQKAMQGS